MPVQMATLALVIGNAMAGIEFQAAGDFYGHGGWIIVALPPAFRPTESMKPSLLSIADHSRDAAGMTYVYPVLSRRAGGVSIGINLNPNNACNWRCIYCQVPGLVRGGPPPIDLVRLEAELRQVLDQVLRGSFMQERVPAEARRLVDLAFSGNGEPTSAAEFPAAVQLVQRVAADQALPDSVKLRLITNGSLLGRRQVQQGIARLGSDRGEVWFKLDAAASADFQRINGSRQRPDAVLARLRRCAGLCPTWVQTCCFALDGQAPSEAQVQAWLTLLAAAGTALAGVHLYGLARPSQQAEAGRLSALPASWLQALAERVATLGLTVSVNP